MTPPDDPSAEPSSANTGRDNRSSSPPQPSVDMPAVTVDAPASGASGGGAGNGGNGSSSGGEGYGPSVPRWPLSPHLLIWQLLVLLAILLTAWLGFRALPTHGEKGGGADTQPPGATETKPPLPGGFDGPAPTAREEVQRELFIKAISDYQKQQAARGITKISREELLKNVIEPVARAIGASPTLGKDVLDRLIGKDGWLEGAAKWGGDLFKSYLEHVWHMRELELEHKDGGDTKNQTQTPAISNYAPVTVTCAPPQRTIVISKPPPKPQTPIKKPVSGNCPLPDKPRL